MNGKEITEARLADIFLELQEKGAHCIDLVSPTHFVPLIINALDRSKHRLYIPVVYNCGGYEKTDTLRMLEGYIDIYLPDFKYADSRAAEKYSSAADYPVYAKAALTEMCRQTGKCVFDEDDMMKKGVIIRHLALPSMRHDSVKVLEWIAENLPRECIRISLMSQYTPFHKSHEYKELNRRISTFEYNYVVGKARELGLEGYMQEKSSAKEEYTPDFDLAGI